MFDETVDSKIPLHAIGRAQAAECGKALRQYLLSHPRADEQHVRMWVSPFRRTRETAESLLSVLNPSIGQRLVQSVRESPSIAERDWGLWEGNGARFIQGQVTMPGESSLKKSEGKVVHVPSPITWKEFCTRHGVKSPAAVADVLRLNPALRRAVLDQQISDDYAALGMSHFYKPPNGESLLDAASRMTTMSSALRSDFVHRAPGDRVTTAILVTHGAAIRAFLVEWFRLSSETINNFRAPPNVAAFVVGGDENDTDGAEPLFPGCCVDREKIVLEKYAMRLKRVRSPTKAPSNGSAEPARWAVERTLWPPPSL